jgi:hypothetical protein
MGAAASTLPEALKGEFQEKLESIEGFKKKIAAFDASVVEGEASKMFKTHNKIIDNLTSRTKKQLSLVMNEFPNCKIQLEAIAAAGNLYANFIVKAAQSKEELQMESIKAMGDYDEELLISIIGMSTINEITALDRLFQQAKSMSLHGLFQSKIKPGSSLYILIDYIFQLNRDESKETNEELAISQAETIYQNTSAKQAHIDEDAVFIILSRVSRHQCQLINSKFQEKYKMKLERAINLKFKGNISKLLSLWTMPIPAAVSYWCNQLLQKMFVDKNKLLHFIAHFDKDMWVTADIACKEQNNNNKNTSIAEKLKSGGISGTLLQVMKGWIENPTPDKGFEKIFEMYLAGKIPHYEDGSLDFIRATSNATTSQELRTKIHFILDKEITEIQLYMEEHKIRSMEETSTRKSASSSAFSFSKSFGGSKGVSTTTSPEKPGGSNNSNSTNNLSGPNSPQSTEESKMNKAKSAVTFTDKTSNNNNNNSNNNNNTPLKASKSVPTNLHIDQQHKQQEEEEEGDGDNTHEEDDHDHYDDHQSPPPMLIRKQSIFAGASAAKRTASKQHQHVDAFYTYLLPIFEAKDTAGESSLTEDRFWEVVFDLPLETFGLNQESLNTIRKATSSAWVSEDGMIYYYESLMELAETLVAAIEDRTDRGETDCEKIIANMKLQQGKFSSSTAVDNTNTNTNTAEASSEQKQTQDTSSNTGNTSNTSNNSNNSNNKQFQAKVPDDFIQYVQDTVDAFDLDGNGIITAEELEMLLQALHIHLLDVGSFLKNDIVSIDPRHASQIVIKAVENWFADTTGEDHYICLIDCHSGAYFWYNTKDQSTQWAES